MGQSQRATVRLLPAITGVILAAGLLAPSAACAECGSYVVYTNPAHDNSMGDHGPTSGKCTGPHCQRVPAPVPAPQAPPHVRILSDDSLPPGGGDSDPVRDTFPLPIDSVDGSPIGRPADVYHPPR
ncbi:MAG TPA: hypothetical protein VKD90_17355 [Gemmataceae bacterium]|nr:hypothetical protein [Gemmataceae bacterium]